MTNNIEDKFLDYIEGTLSTSDLESFEKYIAENPEAKKSLEAYKKIILAENIIHSKKHKLNANFAVKVMDEIENSSLGFFRRFIMELSQNSRSLVKIMASLAAVIVCVQLYRISPNQNYSPSSTVINKKPIVIAPVVPAPVEQNAARLEVIPESKVKVDTEIELSPKEKRILDQGIQEMETEKRKDRSLTVDDLISKPQTPAAGKGEAKVKVGNKDLTMKQDGSLGVTQPREELRDEVFAADINSESDSLSVKRNRRQFTESMTLQGLAGAAAPAPYAKKYEQYIQPHQYAVNAEGYSAYEENPRIEVRNEPSSTFSIDVDTASYANARRFLQAGNIPPKDSVRIEEFLNYFDYNYPVQYEKPFTLSYEIAPSPLETDRYLLKLGIKARDMKESSKPWNLVFLVDVSGSMMDSNKLPLVQKSLRLLTENMREGDKVAIVTYAGSAGTVLESTTIKEKQKILSAIDMLTAGGSTYGSGGIMAAYDVASKNKIEGAVNRVVLATDGDFNVGITSQAELIKLIEEKRKSGITLTTLGFGTGNIQDGTMEQLANKGNGNYYYIDSFQEARKVLETDLAGTMEVVAKDVKLQIEFNPEHVQSYRLIGYENRKLKREDFNNDAIDAGEIGTGHTVTAMYEIVLKDSALAEKLKNEYRYSEKSEETKITSVNKELSPELAFLKIRYKQPEGNESQLLSFPIEKQHLKNSTDEASPDFKFASAVSYFGHKLRNSQYAGSYTYGDIAALAEKNEADDKNGYRREFVELVKNAASLK